MCNYVLGSNLTLWNHSRKRLRRLLSLLNILATLDYGIQNKHTLIFVFIPTQTLLDQRMVKRVLAEYAYSLDHDLYHQCAKSKV